jgi:enoyl-[acyl-carrier protein] reductase II
MEEIIQIIIEEGVKIVFTSAGNPALWTSHLKKKWDYCGARRK